MLFGNARTRGSSDCKAFLTSESSTRKTTFCKNDSDGLGSVSNSCLFPRKVKVGISILAARFYLFWKLVLCNNLDYATYLLQLIRFIHNLKRIFKISKNKTKTFEYQI